MNTSKQKEKEGKTIKSMVDLVGLKLNRIYLSDYLEGLKKIKTKSIDLAFTDPPYNTNKDFGVYKDNLSEEEYSGMVTRLINELRRVTKRGFGIYIDWRHFKMYWDLMPEADPIIIIKRVPNAASSRLKIAQHYHIILTTATALRTVKSLWNDIHFAGERRLFNEERYEHPAQTSFKATKRFIENFSNEKEIILDPFMGTGTTAVVSAELNRKFIGFELNPDYIRIAEKRLAQVDINNRH